MSFLHHFYDFPNMQMISLPPLRSPSPPPTHLLINMFANRCRMSSEHGNWFALFFFALCKGGRSVSRRHLPRTGKLDIKTVRSDPSRLRRRRRRQRQRLPTTRPVRNECRSPTVINTAKGFPRPRNCSLPPPFFAKPKLNPLPRP